MRQRVTVKYFSAACRTFSLMDIRVYLTHKVSTNFLE